MHSSLGRISVLLATLTILAASLFGQATSGELIGTVYDKSGAALPNATVTAKNEATGVETSSTSNGTGGYRIPNLIVGTYDVTSSAAGFTTAEVKGLTIELNKISTQNLTLDVGKAAASVIDVTSAAALIDTTTAQLQNSFDNRAAVDLPQASSGFGVLNLSLLDAGVASSGGVGYGDGPSVGGQRPTNNSFTIEGVDNNEKGITGPVVSIPNDAVAEFSVLANNYSPEFGGSSGGQFNSVVRSGSNEFHGSFYEYLQNRDLNAVDAKYVQQGLTSNPRYDQNRVGATFGGPIKRNKAFFFADAEYNPLGQNSVPGGAINAPTAAGYATLASLPGVSSTNLGILKQFLPAAPTSNGTTNVAGVDIPIGPISVVSPNYSTAYNIVAAGDVTLTEKDQFRLRYIYNKTDFIDNAAALPIFYGNVPLYTHLVALSEFHNFSPTLINELRASYNRKFNNYVIPNFKFPGLDQFPNIVIDQDLNLQLGPDPNTPQGYIQNNYQLNDNITKIWGPHTLKAGYNLNDVIASNTFVQRARGDYDYSNLNQYLLDLTPDELAQRSVGAAGGIPVGFASHAGFVNDDWKLRPNLTINLGIRYEYVEVPVVSRAQALSSAADVPGVLTFRSPKSQTNNWAPRVGFAYSPGTSGTTSIRGGFSMAYDQFYNNLSVNSKPAFYQQTKDADVTSNAPGFLAGGALSGAVPPFSSDPLDARALISSYTYDQIRPYSINWTLGIQHVFAKNYTVEVRYVGSRGVHEYVQDQLNKVSRVSSTNFIPTFFTTPSASQLAALTTTLGSLKSVPANSLAIYGFNSTITGYSPSGNSSYHAADVQVNRKFTSGLSMIGAYTWSHNIDDSTATVFSTYLTPRRGQDFANLAADKSSSALDHRQRLTMTAFYEFRPFKERNWFFRNLVGNWNISGTYTYQSGELATVQDGLDANLNGDTAGDRAIINNAGSGATSTGVTAYNAAGSVVKAGSSSIVAYVANDPAAHYVLAQQGALANGGRNTLEMNPIDNIDAQLEKRFSLTERMHLQIGAQFYNVLNHAQYTGGYLSDVQRNSFTGSRNFLIPGNTDFNRFDQYFPSNSRNLQLVAKFTF